MAENENEEKTYEVRDKRRVNPDGTLKEPEAAEEPEVQEEQEPQAGESQQEPRQEAAGEEVPEMPVPAIHDLMQFMVGMLAEQAWVRMGIRVAPGHKDSDKDLVQAKIAIDTIVFMVDKIHPHIGEEERKALRGLVSDLQINFVRHS